MTAQLDINVKMMGKVHLQLFFECCRCGESVCATGIANDYHYPLWFLEKPIVPADKGYLCSECAGETNQ